MIDLWPDKLGYSNEKAPVSILEGQAYLLGRKTRNLIVGKVDSLYLPKNNVMKYYGTNEDLYLHEFYIEAPIIHDYRHNLVTIMHTNQLYPIIINTDETIKIELYGDNNLLAAHDEEEFIETLKNIFNSKMTKDIINSLFIQIGESTVTTPP